MMLIFTCKLMRKNLLNQMLLKASTAGLTLISEGTARNFSNFKHGLLKAK